MATPSLQNPYTAGPGLFPPYLAGRRSEIETIEAALDLIKDKSGKMDRAPSPALVLSGPRGIGKTALLGQAIEQAEERGIHVAEVNKRLLAGEQHALARAMFPPNLIKKIYDNVGGLGGPVFSLDLDKVGAEIDSAMPVFLAKHPLLIVLDEAHTCNTDGLNLLFGTVQKCMRAKLPLAVVIAGTPGIKALIRKCDATYMERSEILNFNTLSREEAREALEVPAKEGNRPLDQDALDLLLDWADNYPYFVQLAGKETWKASVRREGGTMTIADAKAGLELAGNARDEFYVWRYDEIINQGLQPQAMQVIDILDRNRDGVSRDEMAERLMELNEKMDSPSSLAVVDHFLATGFLWRDVDDLSPGIPSLFAFIVNKKAKKRKLH